MLFLMAAAAAATAVGVFYRQIFEPLKTDEPWPWGWRQRGELNTFGRDHLDGVCRRLEVEEEERVVLRAETGNDLVLRTDGDQLERAAVRLLRQNQTKSGIMENTRALFLSGLFAVAYVV